MALITSVLAGCTTQETPQQSTPDIAWPAQLQGPFIVEEVENIQIEMRDGVHIDVAIWRPDVPQDVRVPVILQAQPYAGSCFIIPLPDTCLPSLEDRFWLDEAGGIGASIVESGNAYVSMSVRGTGDSGGCLSYNGPDEAADIGEVIDHFAAEPWSNGRVAMIGMSYMGVTPWLGALQDRDALRAIAPAAIQTTEYTFGYTPQGAAHKETATFNAPYITSLSLAPPIQSGDPQDMPEWAAGLPDRTCPEAAQALGAYPVGMTTDIRDPDFYETRDLLKRFHEITTPALVVHGFHETSPGHGYQEDAISQALVQAPLTMVLGQWGHTWPTGELLSDHPHEQQWEEMLLGFLDHHLKDAPAPPWMGAITYQETNGTWAQSTAWPPTRAGLEVLYTNSEGLTTEPTGVDLQLTGTLPGEDPACTDAPASHLLTTEPVQEAVSLAGNPMAYLTVETTSPGGLITVDLYDIAPDADCQTGGITWLTSGAADLRFHATPYQGTPFPNEPTPVRIDFMNLAHTLEPGHRLGLALSTWGHNDYIAQHQGAPATIHGEQSHILIPTTNGTLGGQPPDTEYPPRPFLQPSTVKHP